MGNADELLKGADVSVPEDADTEDEDDDAVVDVVDGVPSLRSGIRSGRDTLGNASPTAVRPAVTPGGISSGDGVTESERMVETLVTAPAASTKCTMETV